MHSLPQNPLSASGCEVKQTSDHLLVRRAFTEMAPEARDFLWEKLNLEQKYEAGEIPDKHSLTGQEFLWHELIAAARQSSGSFFVVSCGAREMREPVFAAPNWAIAQAYARMRLAEAHQGLTRLPDPQPVPAALHHPRFKKPPAIAEPALKV